VTGNISITSDIDNVTITVPPLESEFHPGGQSVISSNGKFKTIVTQSPLQISNDDTSVTISIDTSDFADQATTYTKQEVDTEINNRLLAYSQLPNSALIKNCMWGLSFLEPDNTTLFYAPCVANARDVSFGDLWVLTRDSSIAPYGTYEIASNMSSYGGALSLGSEYLTILPNGPTPPNQPNQTGLGWSAGAFTVECQIRQWDDNYCSVYLSSDRDVDNAAPEILYHCCLKYQSNTSYIRWLNATASTDDRVDWAVLPTKTWHHVAITYDGATQLTFYVNGVEIHQFNNAPPIQILDQIKIGPSTGAEVREIAVYNEVKYTSPFSFKDGSRFNALIKEATTINL